jgi:heme oxygenase (biliverdin-producing, ferredoxin)
MSTLTHQLREATHGLHREAESTDLMQALLRGRLPLQAYRALITELLPLCSALEAALQARSHAPWLSGLDLAALQRAPALRADLGVSIGSPALKPATAVYIERLQALGSRDDPALLAHVYTRYMGDLHGGQILRRIVERCYRGQGVAFYDFGGPERVASLREQVREVLARAPLPPADAERVVDEARWSFEQYRQLFEELAAA